MKKQKAKYKSVPAFTMMDMLTGMVIMSIIIAIVFYLMTSTNKQIYMFQQSRSELIEFSLMKSDLYRSVELADKIVKYPNGFKVILSDREIFYVKENELLIRKEGLESDTLSFRISNLEILNVDREKASANDELVDAIVINVFIKNKELKLYLYKSYDSKLIINEKLIEKWA